MLSGEKKCDLGTKNCGLTRFRGKHCFGALPIWQFNPMPKISILCQSSCNSYLSLLHTHCTCLVLFTYLITKNIIQTSQILFSIKFLTAWVNMQFYLFLNSVIWRKMLHTHIVLKCLQLVWHQANYFPLQNTHRIKQNILLPMAYRKYNKFFTMAHTKYNSLV